MDAQAKQEIAELLARAAYALDSRDLAAIEVCFHVEADFTLVIEGVAEASHFNGRPAILELMQGALDAQTDERRHAISNLFYPHTEPDKVTVCSYLTLMGTEGGETRLITTGLYTDQVVQSESGGPWVIVDRHLKLDRPY
ncbi:MAG: nuclear transport factor 2 family protein [Pseudomonadota bacterium]